VDLLTAHREATEWGGPEDFIFCRSDGRPLADYLREQVLYPVLQATGIKRKARENGFHAFRHASRSILYEITRDIELVKRFLRHSGISTTSNSYVHPLELTNEATEAMANVFLGVEEAKGVQ
jgi:integrase